MLRGLTAVLQAESHECGLACLAMVLGAHGSHIDLGELRRRFAPSPARGVTLTQLARQAGLVGLQCRALKIAMDDLSALALPAILHWDLDHFVVLEKVSKGQVKILDPALGRRVLSTGEASQHVTGVALECWPATRFEVGVPAPRLKLLDLVRNVRGLPGALLALSAFALGLELIALAMPQVTQWVVDVALVTGDRDLLLLTVVGGSLLITTEFLLRMAKGLVGLRMSQQVGLQWASNLFSHLLALPTRFFETRRVGDVASRFESLHAVRDTLSRGAVNALLDGLMAAATVTLMAFYSPALSAVAIGSITLYAILRAAFYSPLRDASQERLALEARERSHFIETVRASVPLKLFDFAHLRAATWRNLVAEVQHRETRTQRLTLAAEAGNTVIFGLESMLLLYLGGTAVLAGTMTLGMLLAFLSYKTQFGQRAARLVDAAIEVRMLSLHAERIAEIALAPQEEDIAFEAAAENLPATLEFRDVSFRHADGEPWVLRGLSFTIEAGQSVALVGRSGCGKSTVLKLMLGLLTPTEGEILVGGLGLRALGIGSARAMMGCVMQDDQLLVGSIADNIACFDPEARPGDVEAAARLANVHKAITKLPMGYRTQLGESGLGLSGGQRQRLMLARALYRKPKFLLLDEATSHLDLHSEQHVVAELAALSMTRITVAHRVEAVQRCDRLIRLARGVIEEDMRIESPAV